MHPGGMLGQQPTLNSDLSASASMSQIMVARQPILDRRQDLFAYELLYRSAGSRGAAGHTGDAATATVILTSLVEMGLEKVTGGHPAFVNMTGSLLCSEMISILPPDQVVLEVLETVRVDPAMVEVVRALAGQGYKVALDDFVFTPEQESLVAIADYIKLDVLSLGHDGTLEQLKALKGARAKLVAEKVETREECDWCLEQGFHFLQGYYFCKPSLMEEKSLASRQVTVLALLAKLHDPNVSFNDLDKLIRSDVGLTHRVLKIINSARFSLARKIDSLKEALVLLGLRRTRMWVALIALAGAGKTPREALTATLVRARMCELLAEKSKRPAPDVYFMTGLLSTLGVLLNQELEQAVKGLPLSDAVKHAILGQEGELGEALRCAEAHEKAAWDEMRFGSLTEEEIRNSYLSAVSWAAEVNEQVAE